MTTIHTNRSDQTIDKICRAVGYEGRNVTIRVHDKVHLSGTYWSEGNKSDYFGIDLATCQARDLPSFNPPQFGGPIENPEINLVDGLAIIELNSRGGKHSVTIHIAPLNAAPLLPKSTELTPNEKKVLECTRTYKSSYAGIKDYRFSQSGMNRADWDTAKASLIAKGLLNKAGAITNEGRNAIAR